MTSHKKKRSKPHNSRVPIAESRAAEALTVAWTVTVTTVLLCNLTNLAAYLYLSNHPDANRMQLLQGLMLIAGVFVGILSLVLLPMVIRVRRVPPPTGLVVFGACVAAAPILAGLIRMLE